MEIVKFINSRTKRGLNSLRQSLDYVDNKDKTMGIRRLVGGIAKNSDDAFLRMSVVKKLWNKTEGREYIHFVVAPKGKVSDEKMLGISKEVQGYFKNFGSFYGIHKNTENTHVHFILNSVGWNGKKYSQSKAEMKRFKDFVSELFEKYNVESDNAQEIISWKGFLHNTEYITTNKWQPAPEYRPHINDEYKPACYRMGTDGEYHPVNPVNPDGTVNLIQAIDKKTDIVPMILLIDENGYLSPGI